MMRVIFNKIGIGFFSLIFLISCNVPYLVTDYDREVDFKEYNTYNFFNNIEWGKLNILDQNRIKESIEKEMKAKGFMKSNSPQLLIDIKSSQELIEQSDTNLGIGGGSYGRSGGVGISLGIPIVTKKMKRKLIIEMVEGDSRHLIWQGIYEKNFSQKSQLQDIIPKAIYQVLKSFPPAN